MKERIKKGYPDFGMNAVGAGKDPEGSDRIIKVVDKDDPRPVWIPVWGGVNCLAQALWKVKETRTSEELKKFVKIAHPDELEVKSGKKVTLSAEGSYDPDDDQLNYNWMYYKEAGTYDGEISVENKNGLIASFIAPEVQQKETIHIILAVKDSGNPSLTRYQRAIITVYP